MRANVQSSTLRVTVMLEPRIRKLKNLLHNRILSHIIISLDNLLVLASVRSFTVYDSWHIDPARQRKLLVKPDDANEIPIP